MKQTTLSEHEEVIQKGLSKGLYKPPQIPPPSADVPIATWIGGPNNPANPDSIRWHKSHRNLFVFEFEGSQPTRGGKLSRFGWKPRSPNAPVKAKYNFPEENCLAFTTKHTIMIWAKHPKGVKTVEQLIEARARARRVAETMASKHALTNLKEREAAFSEHTVEQPTLDKLLRPLVVLAPELCKEKLGLTENHTSHPGKLEFTDRDRQPEQLRAKDRVLKLEHILDKDEMATKADILAIRADFSELTGTIKEFVHSLRGPKPPEPQPESDTGGMFG